MFLGVIILAYYEFGLTFPVQFILQRGKRMTNIEPETAVAMETRRN